MSTLLKLLFPNLAPILIGLLLIALIAVVWYLLVVVFRVGDAKQITKWLFYSLAFIGAGVLVYSFFSDLFQSFQSTVMFFTIVIVVLLGIGILGLPKKKKKKRKR